MKNPDKNMSYNYEVYNYICNKLCCTFNITKKALTCYFVNVEL